LESNPRGQLCWLLYCGDNNDVLPPSTPVFTSLQVRDTMSATTDSWVFGNAWTDTTADNIQGSVLFVYSQCLSMYRCPADKSTVRDQGQIPRTRSYSMSWWMGMWPDPKAAYHPYSWHRLDQIRNPGPTKALVFVDEHENSIQAGLFSMNHPDLYEWPGTTVWTWVSFPATRHSNAGTVSFADGHSELWRWQEPTTQAISRKQGWILVQPAVPKSDRDLGRFFSAIPEKVPIR
jgi:prepilin-type processing-associated H-X9-DG protein